jgi:hypothetical protein
MLAPLARVVVPLARAVAPLTRVLAPLARVVAPLPDRGPECLAAQQLVAPAALDRQLTMVATVVAQPPVAGQRFVARR